MTLNLVNVPTPQTAKTVLGDILGVKYTVDPAIEGKVTIQTLNPVTKSAAIDLFQSALRSNVVSNMGVMSMSCRLPSTIGAILIMVCLVFGARAQDTSPADLGQRDRQVEMPFQRTIEFEGAERKNCPTASGMFVLLGERAILSVPTARDLNGEFLIRAGILPDRSGHQLEFVNSTCTIEITIRYTRAAN